MKRKKVILELFSGSKTVSKTFENHGWESISVDNNKKLKPTICCDILELDYSLLPQRIDFIWASPPCTTFSRLVSKLHWSKTTEKYRFFVYEPLSDEAINSILYLQKTVEIIRKYNDANFVIENPVGRMHHIQDIKNLGHYRYGVNYYDYGFNYSKETYLFTNLMLPLSQKKVIRNTRSVIDVTGSYNRSKVPAQLAEFIWMYLPE